MYISKIICITQVIPAASEEQLLLVELVRSISVMRADTVIQTVKEVLKQPPAIVKDKVRKTFSFSFIYRSVSEVMLINKTFSYKVVSL